MVPLIHFANNSEMCPSLIQSHLHNSSKYLPIPNHLKGNHLNQWFLIQNTRESSLSTTQPYLITKNPHLSINHFAQKVNWAEDVNFK